MTCTVSHLGRRLRGHAVAVAVVTLLTGCWVPGDGQPFGAGQTVAIYTSSSAGDRIAAKPELKFGPKVEAQDRPLFVLDDAVRYQKIDGFGASFLEAGLVTLDTLPSKSDQDAVLRALFDRRDGAGFSVMKTPIGATDFQSASPDWYTYDDTPGDISMRHFSIGRDLGQYGLVTYIKRARHAGGNFVLQAPMDYPPDWMLNDVNSDQNVNRQYYQALANYYVKYIREYEKRGIHIDFVSPFNEPGGYTKIPFSAIRDFIRDYLGPTFQKEKITTRIQLSENGSRPEAARNYPVVLDDQKARKYIATLPYHGYAGAGYDDIATLHSKYPRIPMWMTELCCLYDQKAGVSFESGDAWANTIISDLEAGASAWIYWNAILDQDGGPWLVSPIHSDPEDNAQESVVVVDREQHTVTYTGLYYYLAHFSKFVRPGATRIRTASSPYEGLRAISFQNSDGTMVSELVNSRGDAAEVQLDWLGQSLRVTLPPISISTLLWARTAST